MSAEVIGSAAFEIRAIDRTNQDVAAIQRDLESRLKAIERRYGIAGTSAARGFNVGQRQIADEGKRVETEMKGSADRIAASLRRVAGIIAAGFSAREVVQMSDTYKRFSNQLRVAGVEGAALNQVQEALYASAQRNGVQIEALSTLYGRAAQAASSLGASQEDLLKFTDGVTNALRIQGGDPAAASGALLQLSQALQSGTVRAEEFNSVNEGAFPILQAVAAGSERFAGSVGKLRAAVVDGKVSSEEFFRAFLNGSQTLEERASKAALTTAQGFTALQNALTRYIGESDQALGASALLGSAIGKVADNIDTLIPALAVVGTGLGVGMVTRAAAAQLAVNGVTGSLVAMRGAALAAFGGPVGLAITAVTVALGAFAIEGANAAAAARRLEGAMNTASQAVAKADAYANSAASHVKDLGGEATTASGKVKAFAGEVGAAAGKLWELARAKKAAALAEIAGERASLSTTLSAEIARTPEQRRQNPFGRRATRQDEWNAAGGWWPLPMAPMRQRDRVARRSNRGAGRGCRAYGCAHPLTTSPDGGDCEADFARQWRVLLMGAVFTSWLADDLLAEGLAIMLERAQIDSARMDPSEAELAAWDARQDRFFDAIEALPADPAHAGLKALAYAVIHSTDCGMPPKGDVTETRLMRQLWLAAGCDIAGKPCIGGEQ